MQKEKILEAREKYKGWNYLLDILENSISYLTQSVSIKEITTWHGMLSIVFEDTTDPHLTYFLNSLAFKLQRDSVRFCVKCGKNGRRRQNLEMGVYCFHCWVNTSDNLESSTGET